MSSAQQRLDAARARTIAVMLPDYMHGFHGAEGVRDGCVNNDPEFVSDYDELAGLLRAAEVTLGEMRAVLRGELAPPWVIDFSFQDDEHRAYRLDASLPELSDRNHYLYEVVVPPSLRKHYEPLEDGDDDDHGPADSATLIFNTDGGYWDSEQTYVKPTAELAAWAERQAGRLRRLANAEAAAIRRELLEEQGFRSNDDPDVGKLPVCWQCKAEKEHYDPRFSKTPVRWSKLVCGDCALATVRHREELRTQPRIDDMFAPKSKRKRAD